MGRNTPFFSSIELSHSGVTFLNLLYMLRDLNELLQIELPIWSTLRSGSCLQQGTKVSPGKAGGEAGKVLCGGARGTMGAVASLD